MVDTSKKTTEQNEKQDPNQAVKPDMSDWDKPIKNGTMTYSVIEESEKKNSKKTSEK